MNQAKRYSPEVREPAVRLLFEHGFGAIPDVCVPDSSHQELPQSSQSTICHSVS